MPNIQHPVAVAVILTTSFLMTMGSANGKVWPDFSCLPTFEDNWRPGSLKVNTHFWNDCQEEEKTTKMCAKLCILSAHNILAVYTKKKPDDPLIYNVGAMVDHLAEENGYKGGNGGDAATDLMNKVRTGMEDCGSKYKEILGWKLNSTCEKWNPFLTCIDATFGC